MKKRSELILAFLLCFASASQGRTMKEIFKQLPDSLTEELSRDNRLDLTDYWESRMKASVKNNFGEYSSLLKLGKDYVKLQLSERSEVEFKLLTQGTDTTLCAVRTYFAPQPESTVELYDLKGYKKKNPNLIPKLKLTDFVLPEKESGATEEALGRAGTALIKAELSDNDQTLTFTLNCDEGNPELRDELKPLLKDKVEFRWKDGRFSVP
jgi:hypothetical protein